jgi:hypothetical protein
MRGDVVRTGPQGFPVTHDGARSIA